MGSMTMQSDTEKSPLYVGVACMHGGRSRDLLHGHMIYALSCDPVCMIM